MKNYLEKLFGFDSRKHNIRTEMMAGIKWDNYSKAIPAFLTIIIMPLAYSISDGILIGIIAYVICHAIAGKFKDISIAMWCMAALFICKYIFI